MSELEFVTEGVKSSLKLRAVVCLNKDGGKGKSGKHHDEAAHGSISIELIENDRLLVAGMNINNGILVAGPGKPGELWGDVLDIHLEVPDGMNILGMHMNRRLISWSPVIPVAMHQASAFQYAVNR